ncbi:MAG: HDOD domain-containing protein [Actinobacteria bacterium]|nr:HDOD domain-containing protein [Actinomycetota bacterium]
MMGQEVAQKILKEIRDLPPFSAIANRALKLTNDPRASAVDISRVISYDPAFTARVLRMANSAYYGFARKVTTVSEAIVILGYETLKSVVLALTLQKFYDNEVRGYGLEKGDMWKHSVGCALASRLLATQIKYPAVEEAFVAGLLHDVGKVILNEYVRDEIDEIIELAGSQGLSFAEAEKRVLGFDHQDIGSKVAEKWNFNDTVVEAIRCHHRPERAKKEPELTAIVHVADFICLSLGLGIGNDGMLYPLKKEALEILKLDEPEIDNLIYSAYNIAEEIEKILA